MLPEPKPLRSCARSMRYAEEVDLLQEEMRRVQFLEWRAIWWRSQLGFCVCPTVLTTSRWLRDTAYAEKQVGYIAGLHDASRLLGSYRTTTGQLLHHYWAVIPPLLLTCVSAVALRINRSASTSRSAAAVTMASRFRLTRAIAPRINQSESAPLPRLPAVPHAALTLVQQLRGGI